MIRDRYLVGAIAQVSDEQLFTALDGETNSIAIVMKHMAGNMRSRWTDFQIVLLARHFAGPDWQWLSIPPGKWGEYEVSKEGDLYPAVDGDRS